MNKSLKKGLTKTFFQMLNDLSQKEEMSLFWTDFLTENEFEKLLKRISVVYWLKKGRTSENIKNNLSATDKDIMEAKTALKKPGVRLGIKKIEAEEWANVWAEKIKNLGTRLRS